MHIPLPTTHCDGRFCCCIAPLTLLGSSQRYYYPVTATYPDRSPIPSLVRWIDWINVYTVIPTFVLVTHYDLPRDVYASPFNPTTDSRFAVWAIRRSHERRRVTHCERPIVLAITRFPIARYPRLAPMTTYPRPTRPR